MSWVDAGSRLIPWRRSGDFFCAGLRSAALNRARRRADDASMDTPAPDLSSMLDDAASSHPQPSAMASNLISEARAELGTDAPGERPAGWDPRFHVDPPLRTARGGWKLKPGVRSADLAALIDDDGTAPADSATCASNLCDTFFAIAAALLGDAWTPADAEATEIKRSLTRYFDVNGSIDLPPGVALSLAVGTYALPRMLMPETRERVGRAVVNVRGFFSGARASASPIAPASSPAVADARGVINQAA